MFDASNEIKFIDFGVAVALQNQSANLEALGTPVFQAPEVIAQHYGSQSDIWSLGATLYYLASGELPFDISESEDFLDLARKILTKEPAYPSHFSSEFKDLLSQMLIKDPEDRITLSQILAHPFTELYKASEETTQNEDTTCKFDDEILQRMQDFNGSSLLKKAAMRVFVEHVDPKQIHYLKLEF